MPRKKHTPEQIIIKLREAEVALSTGSTLGEAVRQLGVTEHLSMAERVRRPERGPGEAPQTHRGREHSSQESRR